MRRRATRKSLRALLRRFQMVMVSANAADLRLVESHLVQVRTIAWRRSVRVNFGVLRVHNVLLRVTNVEASRRSRRRRGFLRANNMVLRASRLHHTFVNYGRTF